jgi:crotonobetaine/carnitine-CoA ligase
MTETGETRLSSAIPIHGVPARWHDVPALVRDKAKRHGDRPFCEIDGRKLSYRELDQLSDAVGNGLARCNVKAGDCVASFMFNCYQQMIGWLGANKLGAIWAPLNASLGSQDLLHAIRTTGARVLIVDPENLDVVARIPQELLATFRIFITGHEVGNLRAELFDNLVIEGESPKHYSSPQDPAVILFTGGTTGLPKGVVLPHFALICAAHRYREVFRPTPEDHHYTTLQMFHAGGIVLGTLGPLLSDITATLDRRFSASRYWSRVRETGATLIDPIGTMMTVLCTGEETTKDRDHKVRLSLGVSGQIPESIPGTFAKRFGIPVLDVYGLTEAGGALIVSNRPESAEPGSVGRPHGWADIAIVDHNDVPLPPGTIGEIVLRPTVPFSFMLGYHGQSEATLCTMRNQWLHTGDLGRLDENGNLFFAGREAHWLRRRGENISAYEIEDVISRHTRVTEAVIVGVPSELGEEDVMAWVIPSGPDLAPKDIIDWCLDKLAPFKVPRFVRFTDDFPRSAAKREVERTKLKALGKEGAWDRVAVLGPLSSQAALRNKAKQ